jgi:hypothetical protein
MPWNESTEKMVILAFTRMADLFGGKVFSRGLVIYADTEKQIYSEALKLWCRKLNDLTETDFKTGMLGLEQKTEAAYRDGDEMWPPSYAEFRALAFPKTTRDAVAHKYFEPVLALEDQTAKAKRYEIGKKKSGELLQMLGVESPSQQRTNEHEKAALEQAKQLLAKK